MAHIRLSSISNDPPQGIHKEKTKERTEKLLLEMDDLQNILYAQCQHSLLVIVQGMDASGKDGAIKHVIGRLNPQGVTVKSFKVPTAEEAAHDFLWRAHLHAPPAGMIQVFNRSYYEDVLVTRVHGNCSDRMALLRMKAINDFEQLLETHNNTRILKFYLHVSQKEQAKRLRERVKDITKEWKYNSQDRKEARLWNGYMKVYEDCFRYCSKTPWTIVPSDHNWYKEFIIAKEIHSALKKMHLAYPALHDKAAAR
jgi:PPK2 family polyphosphate:nucleotide phosphotransferase